ncbi:MAG TPA: hypothetical protein VGB82_06965 [Alphaproteobacteria bacterium]
MTNKRIGNWAWTLTAEEGVTALVVGRALRENVPVKASLKRRYAAMIEKQKKLVARQQRAGAANRQQAEGA